MAPTAVPASRPAHRWTTWAAVLLGGLALADAATTQVIVAGLHHHAAGESNPILAAAISSWGVSTAMAVRAVVGVVLALALGLAAQRSRLARAGLVVALAGITVVVGLSVATIAGTAGATQSVAACGSPVVLPAASAPRPVRVAAWRATVRQENCLGSAANAAALAPLG